MVKSADRLMKAVLALLGALIVINLACLFLFAAVEALAVFRQQLVADILRKGQPGIDVPSALQAVRLTLLLGMLFVPLAHVVLSRLRAIVRTVRDGDPFIPANAVRLSRIALALLGMQVCDLAFGIVTANSGLQRWQGWQFSVSAWLSVLLVLVLAQVFRHGTKMRDELEGTI